MSMSKDLQLRRSAYEQAMWAHANEQPNGGRWPVLYDAGDLGYCVLGWTGSGGGRWTANWFNSIEKLPGFPLKRMARKVR